MLIGKVSAEKILNSREEETIQVRVESEGKVGVGSAPSGASVGRNEVKAFPNKGIDFCIDFVNNLDLKEIDVGKFSDLKKVENLIKEFDNTEDLSLIGGNTIIALEFAILDLFKPLWKFINLRANKTPRFLGNCVGGGSHFKSGGTDFQEFLLVSPDAETAFDAQFANLKVYRLMRKELVKFRSFNNEKGDENAWAPKLSNLEVLDILSKVVRKVSYGVGFDVRIGLDVAASRLFDGFRYKYNNFSKEKKKIILSKEKQIEFILDLINKYNLFYVEDPLHEEDFSGFKELKKKADCLICGDDLTVTNSKRLEKNLKCVNSVIVKPNQIGSLIKTLEFVKLAKENKITTVMSHRSGETEDASIIDLAFGWKIPFLKIGISGKGRDIKIRRLLEIEREFIV